MDKGCIKNFTQYFGHETEGRRSFGIPSLRWKDYTKTGNGLDSAVWDIVQ
jgi:hypothetical protein